MDLVRLKGTGDGVKIYFSPDEEFSVIIQALHGKLDEFRRFFGSGHCNIYIIGREMSASDKMRLEAIVTAMLPESTINYGERKLFRTFKKESAEKEKETETEEISKEEPEKEETDGPTIPVAQIKEVVTGNFKSSRARFFDGVVKKGRIVESDGHMVLMGNVEEGGKLIAVGNIVVMGGIYGEVEAGCMGNTGAYAAALDLSPEKISIAGRSLTPEKRPDDEAAEPQKAYLINNEIIIEKFWLK